MAEAPRDDVQSPTAVGPGMLAFLLLVVVIALLATGAALWAKLATPPGGPGGAEVIPTAATDEPAPTTTRPSTPAPTARSTAADRRPERREAAPRSEAAAPAPARERSALHTEAPDYPAAARRLDQPEPGGLTPGNTPEDQLVPWHRAIEHLGETVTIEGEVVVTNDIGDLCFVNFTENWQGRFYVVVYDEVYDAFPAPPDEYLLGKTIRVTGEVHHYRGDESKPQIQVHYPWQIMVVEADGEASGDTAR